jgi:eukaryotic-like serine/threonine-protein kinase
VTGTTTLLDGRYSLDEEIGAGGFCTVWRGTDTVLTRPVAVKVLHGGYVHQPEAQARFKAEARHAGAVSHQNIARVYDYGEPPTGPSYLVMELIEGPSLAGVLAGGPLSVVRTLDIVAQVAAGLDAAHAAGLVHRDIKPSNIMFTAAGTVRITDFGIAYAVGSAPLTATGMVMGTPGYLAPERIDGAQAGPASDLYALGIVAYECLAGARPFAGPPLEVAIAHRDRPLPPLPSWLPTEVAELVMVLTAKDPRWRPTSAGQVAVQARRLRDQLDPDKIAARPVPADPPPTIPADPPPTIPDALGSRPAVWPPARTSRSRRPWTLGAAALVALAALACLMVVSVTGFAGGSNPGSRPSSGPQAAPSAIKPPTVSSPAPARSGGQQPSVNPGIGADTATHKPARHHPGRHHHGGGDGNSQAVTS